MHIQKIDNDITMEACESLIIASFTIDPTELTEQSKREFINEHNHGVDILKIYEMSRNNLHITQVCEMLNSMEKIFLDYQTNRYTIKKQ